MDNIIKEHCPRMKICIIRTTTRFQTIQLQYFLDLFEKALEDFPGISADQVSVIQYGGKSYPGTFGIEFKVENDTVPSCYEKVENMGLLRVSL